MRVTSLEKSVGLVQVKHDTALLRGRPELLAHKWGRMTRSAFGFLRGASAMWAHLLRSWPQVLRGYEGEGPLVGDLHVENYGTFEGPHGMTFHVNDFDETFVGPFAFDVARLLTSTLLARSELQVSGVQVLTLAEAALDGHQAAMGGAHLARPAAVKSILDAAMRASARRIEKRLASERRLVRNPHRWPPAPSSLIRQVPAALGQWAQTLAVSRRPSPRALKLYDCTRRIAGTGSIGVERLQALVRGENGPWILELKEVRGSWFTPEAPSAERLVKHVRQVLPEPPVQFGYARLGRLPVVVNRVAPGEDKVSVDTLDRTQLEPMCRYWGYLAGELHRRGTQHPKRWSRQQCARMLATANELAGAHQVAFLQLCDVARDVVSHAR